MTKIWVVYGECPDQAVEPNPHLGHMLFVASTRERAEEWVRVNGKYQTLLTEITEIIVY